MICIAVLLLYLAVFKDAEPYLLIPIGFGMLLVNLPGSDVYLKTVVNSDVKYTADMESKLDSVEDGSNSRLNMLNDFYIPFEKEVKFANEHMYKDEEELLEEKCPICGAPLVVKSGKNGTFIGCSNYPACDFVKKEPKKELVYTGELCPECGKPLVERVDKKGNKFVACSGYPSCKYIAQTPKEVAPESYVKKCPKCGGYLVKKKGKYGTFLGCTNYPTCNYMEKIKRGKRK